MVLMPKSAKPAPRLTNRGTILNFLKMEWNQDTGGKKKTCKDGNMQLTRPNQYLRK